ncbi:Hypothetical predicted protein [Cloeon dipterum]|uniref:FYVE-type domain-containing protein n=2 Tax=Cloeon dipterum TaxID=197152 RepID=A0A8S1C6F8_9INSE|nr:Hypothetical predicted protein [Cloeon dipterum]
MVGSEIAGAQDTIYLCNFRVSVDGEWLCLKELQDVEFSSNAGHLSPTSPTIDHPALLARDPAAVERSNLVNISKLVVKELIETSLKHGRMLDSDHMPLQHFFIVLEHVMRHGLKPKKGLLGPKKELWDVLQMVERYNAEAADITASVRDLPVRTHMGRARAWLRLALMQKKLADYVKVLIDHRDGMMPDFYELEALMMSEESVVIMGLLVGLNVIDCNLCLKGEDLDSQQGVIDFSLYLRSPGQSGEAPNEEGDLDNMSTVLDQKNYIEELNRHLNATVTNLQAKVEALTTTNALMKEDLMIARNSLKSMQEENEALRREMNTENPHGHKSKDEVCSAAERSVKRITLQEMEDLKKQLEQERNRRIEVEKEFEIQTSIKAEMEVAMKLLEKDIHEKQDTVISLRRQLDDIKFINLEMYKKLEACDNSIKHKTELISKLESKTEAMAETIQKLEEKSAMEVVQRRLAEEENKRKGQMEEAKRVAASSNLEDELRLEREWRLSLERAVEKEKDKFADLDSEMEQLRKELQEANSEIIKLGREKREQDLTLEEMGSQLSQSKLQIIEMREDREKSLKLNAKWAKDSEAVECFACHTAFNLTKRKHHCRSCGEIFCNDCSDNQMPLPSSAKPVRVCDECNLKILSKQSVVR